MFTLVALSLVVLQSLHYCSSPRGATESWFVALVVLVEEATSVTAARRHYSSCCTTVLVKVSHDLGQENRQNFLEGR